MENPNFKKAAEKVLSILDERLKKPNRLDSLNLSFSGAMLDFAALLNYGWVDETLDAKGERKYYKGAIALSRRIADCVFVLLASPFQREDDEIENWHYCFFKEGDDERCKAGEIKAYVRCWAIRLDRVDPKDGLFAMDDTAGDDVSDQTLALVRRELDGATAEFPAGFLSDLYAASFGIRPTDDEILARDDITDAAEEFADFLLGEADRCCYSAIRFLYSYLRVLVYPERNPAGVEGVSRIYCSYFFLSVFFVTTDFLPSKSRLGMLVIRDLVRRMLDDGIECEADDFAFMARAMSRTMLQGFSLECWDEHFDRRADLVPVDELPDEDDEEDEDDGADDDGYDEDVPPAATPKTGPDWDFDWDVDEPRALETKDRTAFSYNPDSFEERENNYKTAMTQDSRMREFWDAIAAFVRSEAKAAAKEKKRFPEESARRVLELLEKYEPYIRDGYVCPRRELVALLTCTFNPSGTPSMKITEIATAFFEDRFRQLDKEEIPASGYDPAVEEPLMWEVLECNGIDHAVVSALAVFPDVFYEYIDSENRRRVPTRMIYGLSQYDIWAFAGHMGAKRLDQIKKDIGRNGKPIVDGPYRFEIGDHSIRNQTINNIRFITADSKAGVGINVLLTSPPSAPSAIYPEFAATDEGVVTNMDFYVTCRYRYNDGIGGEYELQTADMPVADFDCITAFAPRFWFMARFLLRNVKYPAYLCAQALSVEDPQICFASAYVRAKSRFTQCTRDNRTDKRNWKCAMAEVDCEDRTRAVYDICGKILQVDVLKVHKGGWIYKITLGMNGCIACDLPVYVHPSMLVAEPRRGGYFAARVILNVTLLFPDTAENYAKLFQGETGPWDEEFEYERRTRDFERIPAERIIDPLSFAIQKIPVGRTIPMSKIMKQPWATPSEMVAVEEFDYRVNALYRLRQIYGWENALIWSENPYGIDLSAVDGNGRFLYWHVVCATPDNPDPPLHPILPTLVVRIVDENKNYSDVVYENFPEQSDSV